MADVGGGAAHVKANNVGLALQAVAMRKSNVSGFGHADNAASGTRQNRVLALKRLGVDQATRRLHEQQRYPRQLLRQLVHIATQYRRQIRVNHSGVTATDHLHERAGLVRGTDLGETNVFGQSCSLLLMLAVTVTMQKHDRKRAQTLVKSRGQTQAQRCLIQHLHHLTMCAHALIRLDHFAVKHLG